MIRSTPPGRRPLTRRGIAWIAGAVVLAGIIAGCQALSAVRYIASGRDYATGYAASSGDPFVSDDPFGSEYPIPSDDQFSSDNPHPCGSGEPTTSHLTAGTATATLTSDVAEHLALKLEYGQWSQAGAIPGCGGTAAAFTNESGWELDVTPGALNVPPPGSVSVLLIRGTDRPPVAFAVGRHCVVTFTENDAKGLVGSAQCHGLVWQDESSAFNQSTPGPSPSGAACDLTVTFEARP
jgi:hypothetical protein